MLIRLYKHKNNRDVAFHEINSYIDGKYVRKRVYWFNIVNKNNIFPIRSDDISILKKDLTNWTYYGSMTLGDKDE